MVWQNVVNALIGIWFIIAPAVIPFPNDTAMAWASVIGGLILLILAGSATLGEEARRQAWIQVVCGLVGIWFIIAPWVLAFTAQPGSFSHPAPLSASPRRGTRIGRRYSSHGVPSFARLRAPRKAAVVLPD